MGDINTLPKDSVPNKLEITLKEGNFDMGYLIVNNKHKDLTPESKSEEKLLSSKAQTILLRGYYYRMDEGYPSAQQASDKDIFESLKYTCIGFN